MPPSASDLHLAFSFSRHGAFGKEDDRSVFKDGRDPLFQVEKESEDHMDPSLVHYLLDSCQRGYKYSLVSVCLSLSSGILSWPLSLHESTIFS